MKPLLILKINYKCDARADYFYIALHNYVVHFRARGRKFGNSSSKVPGMIIFKRY